MYPNGRNSDRNRLENSIANPVYGATEIDMIFALPLTQIQTAMLTINAILKEIKDIPVSRLEELYQFVHSMTPPTKQTERSRKKILSFGGTFGDMSNKDYSDFLDQTKKARTKLFDRNIEL